MHQYAWIVAGYVLARQCVVGACVGTAGLREELWRSTPMPPVADMGEVLQALFGPTRGPEHVRFVARALLECGRHVVTSAAGGAGVEAAAGARAGHA